MTIWADSANLIIANRLEIRWLDRSVAGAKRGSDTNRADAADIAEAFPGRLVCFIHWIASFLFDGDDLVDGFELLLMAVSAAAGGVRCGSA